MTKYRRAFRACALLTFLLAYLPTGMAATMQHAFLVQNSGWMEPFYTDEQSQLKALVGAVAQAESSAAAATRTAKRRFMASLQRLWAVPAQVFDKSPLVPLTRSVARSGETAAERKQQIGALWAACRHASRPVARGFMRFAA